MQATHQNHVLINEVGPRDGLQSGSRTVAPGVKLFGLTTLYDAGLREITLCSFVPAKHPSQRADAAAVVKGFVQGAACA